MAERRMVLAGGEIYQFRGRHLDMLRKPAIDS